MGRRSLLLRQEHRIPSLKDPRNRATLLQPSQLDLECSTPPELAWQQRNGSGGTLSGVAPLFSFFSSKTEVIPEGGITFFLFRARSSKELYVTKGTNYIVQ